MSDFLIPLGGGNEIGGSAYYLSLEGIYEDETDSKEATLKVFSSERSFKPPKTLNSNRCLKIPDVIFKELNVRKKIGKS